MKHFAFDQITADVEEKLKESEFDFTVVSYPEDGDVNIVVAYEKDNRLLGKDTESAIRISYVPIEFDIYAKRTTVKGKSFSKVTVAKKAQYIIANVCEGKYNLDCITCKPTPNVDKDVYKITMIYKVNQIDTRYRFD